MITNNARLKSLFKSVLAALTLCVLTSCTVHVGDYQRDLGAGLAASENFYLLYNEKNFGAMYELGSAESKSYISKEMYISAMTKVAEKRGPARKTVFAASGCIPHVVRVAYYVDYPSGTATEILTWNVKSERAALETHVHTEGQQPTPIPPEKSCLR